MKISPIWALALAVGSASAQPSISLSGGSGAPGGTVAVSISFSSNGTQPTGAQWTLNYSSLDFSSVTIAPTSAVSSISGETLSCPAALSSATCLIINFGSNSVLVPNGTIAIATFHISSTTKNTSSQITLSDLSATAGGATSIGLTGSPTTITINQPTLELVWQNDATRQVAAAYYNGTQGTNAFGWNSLYGGLAGWHVVAATDFDRNGTPDLVWQNDTTRQVTVHYYGGSPGITFQGWAWLNAGGIPGWKV